MAERRQWKAGLMAGATLLSVGLGVAHAQNTAPTAQDVDNKLQSLSTRLGTLDKVPLEAVFLGGAPGLTSNVPTAFGASYGTGGIGASYQDRTRFSNDNDGSMGVLLGLNDATSRYGAEVGLNILDLSNFGDRGSFNFKVFHRLKNNTSVAVGVENVLNWGGTDTDASIYGVVSHVWRRSNSDGFLSRLYLNAGIGNGRFRKLSDLTAGRSDVNVFGSIGTPVFKRTNAFVEWTGQDMNVGLSMAPFKKRPIVVTVAAADVLNKANDFRPPGLPAGNPDAGPRLIIGVGYGFSFTP